MIPLSFSELLAYGGVLIGGALLYFVGNLIFGFQKSGGKRLIIFSSGAVMGLLAAIVFFAAYKASEPVDAGFILPMLFAGAFGIYGIYAIWMSFFASSKAIDKIFKGILDGF